MGKLPPSALISVALLALFSASVAQEISFASRTWSVKTGHAGPGPNTFAASSVTIDSSGALHLRIAHDASTGAWMCGEVVLLGGSLGYGDYVWQVAGDIAEAAAVDPHVVLGLFTYADDTHELDAEFSAWGNASSAANADFAVQPSSFAANLRTYTIPRGVSALRVAYTWTAGRVSFESSGVRPDGTPWREAWVRTGASVPTPGAEAVHMNLWLFRGIPPRAGVEVVLTNFTFTPSRLPIFEFAPYSSSLPSAAPTPPACLPLLPSTLPSPLWGAQYAAPSDASAAQRAGAQYAQLLAVGGRLVQISLPWASIETIPGSPDVTLIADVLAEVHAEGGVPLFNLAVIDTDRVSVPPDLSDPSDASRLRSDLNWTSPELMDRFAAVVQVALPIVGFYGGPYFGLANEVDALLQPHPEMGPSFSDFVFSFRAWIRKLSSPAPLSVGVTLTVGGLGQLAAAPPQWLSTLLAVSDTTPLTYYALDDAFHVVKDPSVVHAALLTAVSALPAGACVVLQEFGQPSGFNNASSVNGGSDATQAAFYSEFVGNVPALLAGAGHPLRAASAFEVVDMADADCEGFARYYNVSHDPAFVEYLCTLGMLKNAGVAKPAWDAFLHAVTASNELPQVRALPQARAPPMGLLSNVFGSSMIFQVSSPMPLWGAASPGALVHVSRAPGGADVTVEAFANGTWYAALPPIDVPGGSFTISVSSAMVNVTLKDVTVGTVLVCGGQSNLSGATTPTAYAFNGTESAAEADSMPWVRIFTVGEAAMVGLLPPQVQLGYAPRQPWAVAKSANVSTFSAVCWMTAKVIARTLGPSHPLGLIESAWSGTCIQAWLPQDALATCGPVPRAQGWQTNSTLYNQLVAPFTNAAGGGGGMSVAGFIYYQGESNAIFFQQGYYECALAALLSSWRAAFNNPTAWWGIVQIAPWSGYNTLAYEAAGVRSAELSVTRADAHATLASAIDLGDFSAPLGSIHPRAKQALGARLAAGALRNLFGLGGGVPFEGPVFAASVEGGGNGLSATITFAPPYDSAGALVLANVSAWAGVEPANECPSTATLCAGFELQDVGGTWWAANASLNADASALILQANASAAGRRLNATSNGFAVWPQVLLYGAAGMLPAFPWRE